MEAKIEDTKQHISEVIYEPFQILSKIIGEESGTHRHKALSSSASELCNLSSLNSHLEGNNSYSIKEQECDSEGDSDGSDPSIPNSDHPKSTDEPIREVELKSSQVSSLKDLSLKTSSPVLEKYSLSALVNKEDEEFCKLCTEELDLEMEGKSKVEKLLGMPLKPEMLADNGPAFDRDKKVDSAMQHPDLPVKMLGFFILCVCAHLILFSPVCEWTLSGNWPDFVRLDGGILRLSKLNKNISRRASYHETKPEVTYINQKIYDLSDSKIYLVSKSLAQKQIWNKKYPICIELGQQDDFMSKAQTDEKISGEKLPTETAGRTGREKEEWFRRLILASKLKLEIKKPPGVSGSKPGVLRSHSRHSSSLGHLTHSRCSSKGNVEEIICQPKQKELVGSV
ncbi:hypothetical protein mRhiFer1_007913 [Rhinolophus ferrumequinum]|uniref:Uncharacterized protein n=1 Tax=Rhinolophus ferrumequinum TaxID=59479 RepID=A0A7J8AUW4_RHIFE|nr:hypothetical protein mRhiFer1_007913 [Rhinolophus ferrumequinum]